MTVGFGGFNRDVTGRDESAGTLFYVNGSHAQAVDDKWSYKLSAGFFTQDALPRPIGSLPSGTPYPPFANTGTSQPKFDGRVDYDMTDGAQDDVRRRRRRDRRHHSHRHRTLRRGQLLASDLCHGALREGRPAAGVLHQPAERRRRQPPHRRSRIALPIALAFDTKTFDVEAGDVHAIGTRHALSYGGNFRHNGFDISLAPDSEDRNEGGAYVQDEIFLGNQFRWVIGGRIDKFSSIDNAVFSPRTTFMYKPEANQTFRVSFNRAFRAPSLINNHLDVTSSRR